MAELADLLTDATARHALARRDIAEVFRILRDAGVSQTRLARATGQQQSEISEIISGRQVQSIALLERIADGLGVPRGLMGLAYSPDLGPALAAPDTAKSEDERRRNLLRHAATVLWGTPVFGAPDPIRVEHASTPVPRRIGLGDVEQVATTTNRLRQLAGDLGGISIAEALTAHARASEALLGAAMREQVRQRLLLALADVHSAAGWTAADTGLRDLARQHFTRGMDCAGAGGDLIRAVANLRQEGRTELHFRQPNEALKLFQLGAASALPHVEGCTYLALGRFDRATVALARAADGAGHAKGCTTLNLGYLATAQLQSGELRSGLHTAERAIGLARNLRSVSVRDGLAPLQMAAAARRDSSCRDLARELATLRSAA